MKRYIKVKYINATPMKAGDYITRYGLEIPEGCTEADDGYLVEFLDGRSSNHPDFQNYIVWMPKGFFDFNYEEV